MEEPRHPLDPVQRARQRLLDFVLMPGFVRRWWAVEGLGDDDLRGLEEAIMDGATAWPVIAGADGLRKMRFSPERSGRGASGAYRVCDVHVPECKFVALLTVYPKSAKVNLTGEEKAAYREAVRRIREGCRERLKAREARRGGPPAQSRSAK